MTDHHDDIEQARMKADQMLEAAEEKRAVSSELAKGWRKSREDNNFRRMLRQLVAQGE